MEANGDFPPGETNRNRIFCLRTYQVVTPLLHWEAPSFDSCFLTVRSRRFALVFAQTFSCSSVEMLLLAVFAAFSLAGPLVFSQKTVGPADDICIGCLCEAASQCNTTLGCQGNTCGLFRITYPYWVDAGKPVIAYDDPNAADAWVRCVTEPFCAAQTVQQYISKFQQDCNQDGAINCVDFASIHHLGGYGCSSGNPWNKQFEAQFYNCLRSVENLTG